MNATALGALRARADRLGVEISYEDVDGNEHHAGSDTLERVVAVLESDARAGSAPSALAPVHLVSAGPVRTDASVGAASLLVGDEPRSLPVRRNTNSSSIELPDDLPYGCHVLEVTTDAGPAECVVVVAPPVMPRDGRLAGSGALFVPTYAVWERDDPLPSFTHLAELARALPALGVDVVSTLPLYATFLDDPFDPSPYAPVSRLHWNELYLDDATLPPAPLPDAVSTPLPSSTSTGTGTGTGTVDWRALAQRRRGQLLEAAAHLDDATSDRLATFVAAHPDVGAYARFQAQRPASSTAADSDTVTTIAAADSTTVETSHVLAQYLADQQLAAIRAADGSAAIALDLPIGSHRDGYEMWASASLFAPEMSVGAPPDTFFADGQNWGFAPQLPTAMRVSGYRLWRQLIERAGRHADILRVDHAMAIHRLWWVPDGCSAADGVYVRYPREELLAVIAAAAAASGVTIVGEDLGTVPPAVTDAFKRWDVLGMYEEQFHLDEPALAPIPERTVAGIRTHDMAALAEVVATTDTRAYRRRLGASLGLTVDDEWAAVVDAMLRRLADSDAYLVMADLDDLIGETRPHNLPGRVVPGLWQRRLGQPISELLTDPDVRHRLSILGRTTR